MLRVENLSHTYGRLAVLRGVCFNIKPKEKVGLIGPNGAGKTTMFNLLTGLLRPASGKIYFLNKDVTAMPAHNRASLGMARSFQVNTLFSNLSLLDNVRLAIQGTQSNYFRMFRPMNSYADILEQAKALLETMHLWEKRDASINTLSHGEQRQLEILLALASRPKLLLMDEPSAGITSSETANLVNVIRRWVADTTVLFCAHDMELVFSLADRVIVVHAGQVIAEGTPEQIQANSDVKEIYLGTGDEDTRTG